MKTCAIKLGLELTAFVMLILFLGGFVWSLYPLGGDTFPHWIESKTGMPFNGAAFLVSLGLGIVIVLSISAAYIGREADWCGEGTKNN